MTPFSRRWPSSSATKERFARGFSSRHWSAVALGADDGAVVQLQRGGLRCWLLAHGVVLVAAYLHLEDGFYGEALSEGGAL